MGSGAAIYYDPHGIEKMSEILLRFVEPYMELVTTDEALEKLLTVAIVAWNAAMLPPNERARLSRRPRRRFQPRPVPISGPCSTR
jgi:hypothetical protein